MAPSRTTEPADSPRPAREPLLAAAPLVVLAGKGGVGKTTCAAAVALAEARAGRRALVVSIDPAHSLGDALGRALGPTPERVEVAGVEVHAAELDAASAYSGWLAERREAVRTALSRGTWLDEAALERFLDLAPPGLDALMAWHELERFAASGRFDRVLVDPAPAGRLASLVDAPAVLAGVADSLAALNAKHRVLAQRFAGDTGADATAEAIDELARTAERLAAWIRDPRRCAFVWVATPERLVVAETIAGATALAARGVPPAAVVLQRAAPRVNPRASSARAGGIAATCATCAASADATRAAERSLRAALGPVPIHRVPALATEPRGRGLLAVARALARPPRRAEAEHVRPLVPESVEREPAVPVAGSAALPSGASGRAPVWLERVAPPELRLLVVTGKGGTGKSSCAAALALELAERHARDAGAREVLLLSVDPAHSLGELLEHRLDDEERAVPLPGRRGAADERATALGARELDAACAFDRRRERWRRTIDAAFAERLGQRLDARLDREALARLVDLAPPGLDELGALFALIEELELDASPPRVERDPASQAHAESQATDGPTGPEQPAEVAEPARTGRAARLVVLDTPATGHALDLLALPERALAWVHAALEVLLAWPEELRPHELARELLALARGLRGLRALVTDRARACCVAVTRAAELPRRETVRLAAGLERLGVELAVVVVNATSPAPDPATPGDAPGGSAAEPASACPRCRRAARAEERELRALDRALPARVRDGSVTILAPKTRPAPRGTASLAAWLGTWRLAPLADGRRSAP